jgi:hypothetical protein
MVLFFYQRLKLGNELAVKNYEKVTSTYNYLSGLRPSLREKRESGDTPRPGKGLCPLHPQDDL